MIYQIRTYTINRGMMEQWVSIFNDKLVGLAWISQVQRYSTMLGVGHGFDPVASVGGYERSRREGL